MGSVARAFGVHRGTVSGWCTKARRGTLRALRRRKATGRPRKLDCAQYGARILCIVRQPATRFGFSNPLWTCRRIRDVLRKELRLRVSVPTVWRALRALNLSRQKPERRAIERDPAAREKWLKEEWPQIRALAKHEKALIFFEDEAGIHLTPTVGYTWAPVGQRPTVPVTGKRGCISTMSAITPEGRLFFMIPREKVNALVFVSFLEGLLREHPRRQIFVVTDKASSHTAAATRDFVETQPRLRLFFLPTYSPDLNPDEKVWNHLKNHALAAHSATDKVVLRKKTMRALRSLKVHPSQVRSCFARTPLLTMNSTVDNIKRQTVTPRADSGHHDPIRNDGLRCQ